mmetsp:Transcript_45043/g.119053  ORF Transcript_45043/g.119053 Transcript_45043/m.119053 type:complete len:864 (-) Transcript_45043:120-2711(-)
MERSEIPRVREQRWDPGFHRGRIPDYDPMHDRHCGVYQAMVARGERPRPARRGASTGVDRPRSQGAQAVATRRAAGKRTASAVAEAENPEKVEQMARQVEEHIEHCWETFKVPQHHRELYRAKYFNGIFHPKVLLQEAEALAHDYAAVLVVMRSIASREAALARLRLLEKVFSEGSMPLSRVQSELVDVLLALRSVSLEVVESIVRWRHVVLPARGVKGPASSVQWFENGENYLIRMKIDSSWLAGCSFGEILDFSLKSDPFLVYPSAPPVGKSGDSRITPVNLKSRKRRGKKLPPIPLQREQLHRIHAAEMVLLEDSLHVHVQQQERNLQANRRALEELGRATSRESSPCAAPRNDGPAAEESAAKRPKSDDHALVSGESPQSVVDQPCPKAGDLSAPVEEPATAPQPARVFQLHPWSVTVDEAHKVVAGWLDRANRRHVDSMLDLPALMKEDGTLSGREALQFFWLCRQGQTPTVENADGLVVFRVIEGVARSCQIVHLSLAREVEDWHPYAEALACVRRAMLTELPVSKLRTTLVCGSDTGVVDKELEQVWKDDHYKWFQLTQSSGGGRGQVMNRNRYVDELQDPPEPQLIMGISVAVTLVATVAGEQQHEAPRRPFASRLLGAELSRGMTSADAPLHEASAISKLAEKVEKVPLATTRTCPDPQSASAFAKELGGMEDNFDDEGAAGESERRVAVISLQIDWAHARADGDSIVLAVYCEGKTPSCKGPIFYVATTKPDIFMLLIPWAGEDVDIDLCARVAEMMKVIEPVQEPEFPEVAIPKFSLTQRSFAAGLQGMGSVRQGIAVDIGGGRPLPGALHRRRDPDAPLPLQIGGQFLFVVWHVGVDELDEPLVVVPVQGL